MYALLLLTYISFRYWLSQLYDSLYPPFFMLGCSSNLAMANIKEAQDAFQVVRNWIPQLLDSINPLSPPTAFLTTIMKLGRLAVSIDRQKAETYLYRARCLRHKPKELLRDPHEDYIVEECLKSMDGRKPWCISAGLLFLRCA
jgi:hypothetical protein